MTSVGPVISNFSPEAYAVVTGASGGIGSQFSRQLAERGYNLALVARGEANLAALAEDIRQEYRVEVQVIPADLSILAERERVIDFITSHPVHVLCNNAGVATFGKLAELDSAQEHAIVELNVNAVHDLTLAVLPQMLARCSGGVLIVGSAAGQMPIPGNTTYSASKAFINSFSVALRHELRKTGVHMTLLSPGPVRPVHENNRNLIDRVIPQFMWTSTAQAAHLALNGLAKNARRVTPGLMSKGLSLLGSYAPEAIVVPIVSFFYSFLAHSATPSQAEPQLHS